MKPLCAPPWPRKLRTIERTLSNFRGKIKPARVPRAPRQSYNIVHISQPQRRWHSSRAWPARRDPRGVRARQLLLSALGLACSTVFMSMAMRPLNRTPTNVSRVSRYKAEMRIAAAAVCVAVAHAFAPTPAALRLATSATYVHPLAPPISSLALSARVREATSAHLLHTRMHSERAYAHVRMQVGGGGLEKLGGDANAYMKRIKELKEEMSSGAVSVDAMCGTL